jgi:hypothetical protein
MRATVISEMLDLSAFWESLLAGYPSLLRVLAEIAEISRLPLVL